MFADFVSSASHAQKYLLTVPLRRSYIILNPVFVFVFALLNSAPAGKPIAGGGASIADTGGLIFPQEPRKAVLRQVACAKLRTGFPRPCSFPL